MSNPQNPLSGCIILLLPLHPAFNEKSKNHCAQLQCISSTLYRNLTDGRTNERTKIKCLSNGRKNLITLKDQTKIVSKFSRNMLTEIRCEICINHFVEIIFTLACAVVDINLLQINCSQNYAFKTYNIL